MLNNSERIIVEALKRAPLLEIRIITDMDEHIVRIKNEKSACHDFAMALQTYFNHKNQTPCQRETIGTRPHQSRNSSSYWSARQH